MEEIADLFKTKVINIVRDKSYYIEKAFGIRTDTLESRVELFNYLNKYPLFGYKYFYQANLEKIRGPITPPRSKWGGCWGCTSKGPSTDRAKARSNQCRTPSRAPLP